MPHRATNAMNRSRSRRERVALSAVLGCGCLTGASALSSWQSPRQHLTASRRYQLPVQSDTAPPCSLVKRPAGLPMDSGVQGMHRLSPYLLGPNADTVESLFEGVPGGFEESLRASGLNISTRNRTRGKKASDESNPSSAKVRSSRRQVFARTKLFYRNGDENDCMESTRSETVCTKSVRLNVFAWCRKVLIRKDQSQDDLDRYLKFLDHRYNRLHDDNLCYDDRMPRKSSNRRGEQKAEDVYSALGLTDLVVGRSNNIFPSTSSPPIAGKVGGVQSSRPRLDNSKILLSASMIPAMMLPEVFRAGFVLLKKIHVEQLSMATLQKKLVSSYMLALSVLYASWAAMIRGHLPGEIVRSVKACLGAVAGAVCFFLSPASEITP